MDGRPNRRNKAAFSISPAKLGRGLNLDWFVNNKIRLLHGCQRIQSAFLRIREMTSLSPLFCRY